MFIKPFNDKELAGNNLVEGEATGLISKVIIGNSKSSGDPMLTLVNKVWDINENEVEIHDFIPLTDKMRWKLGQVFKSIGKGDILKEGVHTEDLPRVLNDCSFKCEIELKPSIKDPSKSFMSIKRYFEVFIPINNELPFGENPPIPTENDIPY